MAGRTYKIRNQLSLGLDVYLQQGSYLSSSADSKDWVQRVEESALHGAEVNLTTRASSHSPDNVLRVNSRRFSITSKLCQKI